MSNAVSDRPPLHQQRQRCTDSDDEQRGAACCSMRVSIAHWEQGAHQRSGSRRAVGVRSCLHRDTRAAGREGDRISHRSAARLVTRSTTWLLPVWLHPMLLVALTRRVRCDASAEVCPSLLSVAPSVGSSSLCRCERGDRRVAFRSAGRGAQKQPAGSPRSQQRSGSSEQQWRC